MSTPSDIPLRQIELTEWRPDDPATKREDESTAALVAAAFEDRPLMLHLRRATPLPGRSPTRLIVFVHGLQSSAMTWLPFLEQAFPSPDLQAYDFGLFNYQTSVVSRLNPFQRLPRPEDWARVLASTIQTTILEQERYESFVLVGHSMGGLVSKFALRYLVESGSRAVERLEGLFTYGTPNQGSDKASVFGSLLSPDPALLRSSSGPIHDLRAFWNSRISPEPGAKGRLTVHERAVISAKDIWVTPMSGMSTLPEHYVLRIASSHTGLIKPTGPKDPRLTWLADGLKAIRRSSECQLIGIRNAPTVNESVLGEGQGEFLRDLHEALFVFDIGEVDGVQKGDTLGLYYQSTDVTDAQGLVVDRIPGYMNGLRVDDVSDRVSYARLDGLAYAPALEALQRTIVERQNQGGLAFDQSESEAIILGLFGRTGVRVPREEATAIRELDEVYGRARDYPRRSRPGTDGLRELLRDSREFLNRFPESVLRDTASFHEAWATMQLERYPDAKRLFSLFCRDYPFSVSVPGAREWVEEIDLRLRLAESGGSPEQQLVLADYLLKKGLDGEEATWLAADAYRRKPAVFPRISFDMRMEMAAEHVFHQLLDVDIFAPGAQELVLEQLKAYHGEEPVRDHIRSAVQAKVPPESAALLIELLDATSAELCSDP